MLQAIETRYAGCRFRSRLEARWAVFFDACGFRWEYEPQGFQLSWRLSMHEGQFSYLPDFWLPRGSSSGSSPRPNGLWVEVKGSLDANETWKLVNAAAALSANSGGGCGYNNGGNDLLVLGPVHEPARFGERQYLPIRLHMHTGDLQALRWPLDQGCSGPLGYIAQDCGGSDIFTAAGWTFERARKLLLQGFASDWPRRSLYTEALRKARSARFEHGESG